jgi:CRP-like cAMP-binding protein
MALLKWQPKQKLNNSGSGLDIERLRNVNLFADLKDCDEALQILAGLMHEKTFAPKHYILKEGESGSELFILLEGEVSIFKATPQGDQYKVVDLHGSKGVFFGEGGLLDAEARSASIQANVECKCLILDKDGFSRFCNEHSQWALPVVLHIARLVNGRLRKTNQDLLLLYNALVSEIQGT